MGKNPDSYLGGAKFGSVKLVQFCSHDVVVFFFSSPHILYKSEPQFQNLMETQFILAQKTEETEKWDLFTSVIRDSYLVSYRAVEAQIGPGKLWQVKRSDLQTFESGKGAVYTDMQRNVTGERLKSPEVATEK